MTANRQTAFTRFLPLTKGDRVNCAVMVVSSQVKKAPLPNSLPFRVISGTIGQGAYAFIRKACPLKEPRPVIAVKFIHKEHAYKLGRVKPKQIQAEVALHAEVGIHQNIIQYLASGEDHVWTWIAMELAEGDLFDKVEADEGVGQDIAHFYFRQLISAVGYMHSKGVAHRDIKPENMLLSDGNLKVADFGLAVLFRLGDQTKKCQTVCGSPPYMAPEVVPRGGFTGQKTAPYDGEVADIWSCAIVLFVLLVGNTPWDEPTRNSAEFVDYLEQQPMDELWSRIPLDVLSLLRGMLRVDPDHRFTLADVRRHPWFTRPNDLLTADDRAADPLAQATQMLGKLRIDFSANPLASSQSQSPRSGSNDRMDVDTFANVSLTQPETPAAELVFDWEQPARIKANEGLSASQPMAGTTTSGLLDRFMADPALSQFSSTQMVPLSVTQQARRFKDIVPEQSLTRFLSFMDFTLLLPLLSEAFARLAIPITPVSQSALAGAEDKVYINIKTRDQRNCLLAGIVRVEQVDDEVLEVVFTKVKGDPLEWRRLFKKIAVLCKDAILRPE